MFPWFQKTRPPTRSPIAAVLDPLHRLDVAGLVPALGAGDDRQVLLLRLLGGGQDLADAGAVDGDGLLAEDVLAGLDGVLQVLRAEARRGGQDDQVAAVDHLLEGVEAVEAAVLVDVELVLVLAVVLEAVVAVVDPVLEDVAEGVDLDVVRRAGGLADVLGRAGAPAAAADDADLDRRRSWPAWAFGQEVQRRGAGGGGRRGRLEEVAARGGAFFGSVMVGSPGGVRRSPRSGPARVERRGPGGRDGCGATVGAYRVLFLPLTTSDLTPLRLSCSSSGRTTRKPTNVASVCHQMLCGRCGSWTLHSRFEASRAARPEPVGVVVPRPAAGDVRVFAGGRAARRAPSPGPFANVL